MVVQRRLTQTVGSFALPAKLLATIESLWHNGSRGQATLCAEATAIRVESEWYVS